MFPKNMTQNRGIICYGTEGHLPLPYLSLSRPRPQLALQLRFNFFKIFIKTKISLHNSSIHRNGSIFLSIFLPLWYYIWLIWFICRFSLSFTFDLGKLAPTSPPPPPDFDGITPLTKKQLNWRCKLVL